MTTRSEQYLRTDFPIWKNLADKNPAEFGVAPWDWDVSEESIHLMQAMPKPTRKKFVENAQAQWNIYACALGVNWYAPVSTTNPPIALLGFAADYDCPINFDYIVASCLEYHRLGFQTPNYIETTLSSRVRCVWTFERPVPVDGKKFADEVIKKIAAVLNAENFLPGFDRKSLDSVMRWTNGGFWSELPDTKPLSADLLLGIAVKTAVAASSKKPMIPFDKTETELRRRYPRFQNFNGGHLSMGATGIRFWDETADNANSAQVIDKGFFCLTGPKPIMTWEELLGPALAEQMRATNFGEAAKGMFFDGRRYYMESNLGYHDMDRTDMLLAIATHGFNRARTKGEVLSPAEGVLSYIQHHKRVDGAAPLLYLPNGVVELVGKQLLNTSRIKPMRMSDKTDVTPADFPWIEGFLQKVFVVREGDHHPRHYFQVWMKRFYKGAITGKPVNGQAVFFCGPNGCGKNFVSELLIPTAMGGTSANPYKLLMGETGFSDDVLEVPVLAINDEDAPPDFKRNMWEQKIKSIVANNVHSFHAKFAKNVRIVWYGRLIVTLNDGPKDIGILPMLHNYTKDKMSYFLMQAHDHPFFDIYENSEIVKRELPYFLRWLVSVYQPPEGIETGDRFGTKSYHDPLLVRVNRQEQLSYNLLELISAWVRPPAWNDSRDIWTGTPTDLIHAISSMDSFNQLVKTWEPNKVSKALGDLARSNIPGVKLDPASNGRHYILSRSGILQTVSGDATDQPTEQTDLFDQP